MNSNNSKSNKLVSPGSKQAIDKMKYKIANEFGVTGRDLHVIMVALVAKLLDV